MAEPKENPHMEKIVSLCKRRGFVFQSSEIYGGINGFWDYGPLGAELKRNVKELWWHTMTRQRDDVAGLEATIIMSPQIWKASGHVDTFSDPMCDCLLTKKRFRADQIEPQSANQQWCCKLTVVRKIETGQVEELSCADKYAPMLISATGEKPRRNRALVRKPAARVFMTLREDWQMASAGQMLKQLLDFMNTGTEQG